MKNYYELLAEKAKKQPHKLLLQIDAASFTYENMLEAADQLGEKLTELTHGDCVLVHAEGIEKQLAAFFALQKRDCLPILLHEGMKQEEIQHILHENHLQALMELNNTEQHLLLSGEMAVKHAFPDCLGVLSSGSTGTPKVMYRTFESWAGFFPTQNPIFKIAEDTRLFLQGNLSFTGNMNSLLSVLFAGGSVITSRYFRCRKWLELISRHKVDVIYLVPAKLQLLLPFMKRELPSVRMVFTGSQLLSRQALEKLYHWLPNTDIILYYGASELNYITWADCRDLSRDPMNLGKPFPGIGLQVENGLVYVDTQYHVSGVRIPFTVEDTGYLNDKGELIFQGRRQGWVNKGGFKISCMKVEMALREVDGIRNAAVMSCEDALRGAEIAAFIVLAEDAEEHAVRQSIRHSLKPVEVPGRILFVPEIPLNDRGKVDKPVLWAML